MTATATTNFLFSQRFWNHPRPDRVHYRETEETGCFERIQHRGHLFDVGHWAVVCDGGRCDGAKAGGL